MKLCFHFNLFRAIESTVVHLFTYISGVGDFFITKRGVVVNYTTRDHFGHIIVGRTFRIENKSPLLIYRPSTWILFSLFINSESCVFGRRYMKNSSVVPHKANTSNAAFIIYRIDMSINQWVPRLIMHAAARRGITGLPSKKWPRSVNELILYYKHTRIKWSGTKYERYKYILRGDKSTTNALCIWIFEAQIHVSRYSSMD